MKIFATLALALAASSSCLAERIVPIGHVQHNVYTGPYASSFVPTWTGYSATYQWTINLAALNAVVNRSHTPLIALRIRDNGNNTYSGQSDGADVDYLTFTGADLSAGHVGFAYDGPMAIHQAETEAQLAQRVSVIDTVVGDQAQTVMHFVSLGRVGQFQISTTGFQTGGFDITSTMLAKFVEAGSSEGVYLELVFMDFRRTDLNQDGTVGSQDMSILFNNWGQTGENIADLNDDGIVNSSDYSIQLNEWGFQ